MPAKFEIFLGISQEFYFRLKAGNGEVILHSEGYTTKANCINGVRSVKTNAPEDRQYKRHTTQSGHHFTLSAINHQTIGTSETYKTPQACDKGIESVKKNAPDALVADLT